MNRISGFPRGLLIGLVTLYRLLVSPMLAPTCRFWPSCSEYALDALRMHGAARGGWLAAMRVCRCHPWSDGGVDPVPRADLSAGREDPCQCGASRDHSDASSP